MAIDFRKQIEETQRGHTPEPRAEKEPTDPTAVSFPMQWWMLALAPVVLGSQVYFFVQVPILGDPSRELIPVLIGAASILAILCWLPNSLRIDSRGVHQVHFLGLWERTIEARDIRCFRAATRGELRRAGWLRFQLTWKMPQRGDSERVVWVGSKSSRRYLLHGMIHRGRERFMKEMHDRGYPEHGYEGWEAFMEDRGIPVGRGKEG